MLLSVPEAAQLLQVSEKTVYQWIRKDDLPACKINEAYRLNRIDLLEWATEHQIQVSPDLFSTPEPFNEILPTLTDALATGGIHYGITGEDKTTILQGVVATFNLPPTFDRGFLLQVLLAREALGTTAIGGGIAIPHVRNPILLNVSDPAINLCFLSEPIDFGAIDGKAVQTLFTLISPTIKIHLHLLSRLAFALRQQKFRAVLHRAAPASEISAVVRQIETQLPNGG